MSSERIKKWAEEIWSSRFWKDRREILDDFQADIIKRTKDKLKPAVALQLIEFNVSIEDRRKIDRIIDETRII